MAVLQRPSRANEATLFSPRPEAGFDNFLVSLLLKQVNIYSINESAN